MLDALGGVAAGADAVADLGWRMVWLQL